MLLIWDRLPGHRSRLVSDYIATLNGDIEVHYLPAYAPELNPAEYIWAHLKQHEWQTSVLVISGIFPPMPARPFVRCNVATPS